ncbi:MAG: PIN domain-containing protein [Chloroflexota bacterium]
MTAPLLDTSVIVRYLSDDPKELADQAGAIIDGPSAVSVEAIALAEAAYVLKSVYHFPRERIIDALIALVEKENVQPLHLNRTLLVEALRLCRPSGRISIPDALIWAEARSSGANAVYSFDRQFPRDSLRVLSSARDTAGGHSDTNRTDGTTTDRMNGTTGEAT